MISSRSEQEDGQGRSSRSSASGVATSVTVTPRSSSDAWSRAGISRVSWSGTQMQAPAVSGAHTSVTDASKPGDAIIAVLSDGPSPALSRRQATTLASERCSTITPLGRPVEPEV